MVSRLTHWAALLYAYARRGEAGLEETADRVEAAAHDEPGGKFGKGEALYLPQAPVPPTLWRTSCGRCRFYEAGAPGEPATCHVVGREGDRFGGEAIHYRGWCAYWVPPAGEPAFAWVRQRLDPDGKTSIRGTYDPSLPAPERPRTDRARASDRSGHGTMATGERGHGEETGDGTVAEAPGEDRSDGG